MEIEFGHQSISSDFLVKQLALRQDLQTHLEKAAIEQEIPRAAEEEGVSVSDEEVQRIADEYRKSRGLHDAESTKSFLEQYGLNIDEFSDYFERRALEHALRQELFDDDQVEEYFVNNRAEFDQAQISVIDVDREPMANELKMQLEDEGADFRELAKQYSRHESRYRGGALGLVRRPEVDPSIAGKLFNADPGEILGPLKKGGQYRLILVEDHIEPELDDELRETLRNGLYRDWILNRIS